ncbi:MAG: 50S ribosomal protein L15 [Candidatus Niyogibacteria bacterium CG10_big_fil_rev_8_21_14_0_10_46_36]|uniref:Large ribosomal subunit protein uL15 n=1 Tax=Candidatus Niyogibacteria bacterium CG10_big_fil_rev_8_21_14_0_10_46_36 TaxID=1974726 RepID=A0A2H0TCC3_9BACT|nr:MAG: 50S ribosomal protein L15 [Candidatus Niyogibacteria bacterium CG10_big_fil_rev_8_21_14_0_10_46_36]
MQFHTLTAPKRKTKKRVGRGGKRGTYSGRGLKGQKARAGRKLRPEFRDIIKKLPKKRGYRMKSIQKETAEVSLGMLEKNMKDGETVTPKLLASRGLVKVRGNIFPTVKLLGSGKITKKLLVKDCQISKGAKAQIEKAGGKVVRSET